MCDHVTNFHVTAKMPNQLLLVFAAVLATASADQTPLVLWHGMGDSCCNPLSLGRIMDLIKSKLPGIYIHSIQIGSNMEEDIVNGFFKNANDQIDMACQMLTNDPKLSGGFNAMGFSQGGQFLRALVQRCPTISVKKLISVGGQHQGVFGFPRCPGNKSELCEMVRHLLDIGAYVGFVQKHLVQAEYWQDPFNLDHYKKACIFLPDINNENVKNETYKENLMKLEQFVMVMFLQDTMVQPKESEWFGFYKAGQDKQVYTLQESELYQEDWLGLKAMDGAGKLKFLTCDTDHLQFSEAWFIANLLPLITG